MFNNLHPSDRLLVKATIFLFFFILLVTAIPALLWILVAIGVAIYFINSWIDTPVKLVKRSSYDRAKYEAYLKSDTWKAKRRRILARDGYTCKQCGSHSYLQVHHISYERLGHELDWDLVSVCLPCHKKIHEFHGKNAKFYPLLNNPKLKG